ncbi:MAG: type II toxin-antitoxin system RelE/ParE family toxin [Methylovirgula sp.]|uniref:type II toxin-antitoxin system RelE/ParE family toxin n=1 Tax=Methylovirgula sp. TaxID=1978224 RepID=UPI0030765EF5
MGHLTLTPRARADLDDIWLHIALNNLAAADRLIDEIASRCENLTAHPLLGPARPEIAPNARSLVVGNYVVLYRLAGEGVEVVRIVHGARELQRLFDVTPDDV